MPRRTVVIVALLLAAYVASYLWLSRRGYEQAEQWNLAGFYYFTPQPTDTWRAKHCGCMFLFAPLNAIDRWLGPGRHPACEPMWSLSR